MRVRRSPWIAVLAVLAVLPFAAPAKAASTSKQVPLEFDKWYDLSLTDGPVTLHRIRLERKNSSTRGKIFRPGSADHMQDVEIELEFSNTDKKDWKALLRLSLLDGDGNVIDGYANSENLDDGSNKKRVNVTLPSLIYGLDRAKTLKYEISTGPE